MSQYEKVAVAGARALALGLCAVGLVGFMHALFIALRYSSLNTESKDWLLTGFVYAASGALFYFLSEPVGRALGKNL